MILTDRLEYAKSLKKAVEVGQQLKSAMESLGMPTDEAVKIISSLKDKLDAFDVYTQKTPYSNRCAICLEEACVCYTLNKEEPIVNLDELFK